MNKSRLEAFSDGVLAIIITIMVLELKVPHGTQWEDLKPLLPVFLTYILSFIYVGIYWNNHHHLWQAVTRVNGKILWANLFLLFWLSLFPFATGWMGENHFDNLPVALYGMVLLMANIAWQILILLIIKDEDNKRVNEVLKRNSKTVVTSFIYIVAIVIALLHQPFISCIIYVITAFIWFLPDTRLEKLINERIESGNYKK